MAAFGILGLLIFIYARPQELAASLERLPFLYVLLALAVLGIALDVGLKRTRIFLTLQLGLAIVFVLWSLFTLAVHDVGALAQNGVTILVCLALYIVISQGIQSIGAFKRTIIVLFALGMFVAAVGVHQRHAPTECVVINPMDRGQRGFSDGRPCTTERDGEPVDGSGECYETGQPGLAYVCEHVGLFGTTSIGGGRVRYIGVLTDPNELALATALAVPFAFAFFEMRRNALRFALLFASLALVATALVYTQSRGGQVVLAAVLGAYFVKRYGLRNGFLVAAVMAIPLLVLGGRQGEEADQSSMDRLEAAGAGLKMLMHSPLWGVGYSEFGEHHYLTAHNAYVLAGAELGSIGLLLFCVILYLSAKIPLEVLSTDFEFDDSEDLKSLAMAILAAFAGLIVGVFFLSWTYHYVLWIHIGLSGALYAVVKARDPDFAVRLRLREVAMVGGVAMTVIVALAFYVRYKEAW